MEVAVAGHSRIPVTQEQLVDPHRLPVQSRTRSVVLLLGVVIGLLVAGLAIPFAFGERLTVTTAAPAEDGLLLGPQLDAPVADGTAAEPVASAAAGPDGAAGAPGAGGTDPVAPGVPGADGGAPAPGAPGSDAPGTAPDGRPLTATDRGVTAKTIKVGFTVLDTGGLGRTGVAIGVSVDQQRDAWIAYAKEINARGGINGRTIEPVVVAYDPVNENSQRQACLQLTQDEKVFAVVGGFNFPVAVSCVTRENQTPLISGYPSTQDEIFAQANGRFVTMYPKASRMMAMMVAALDGAGKLKGRTIGILNQQQNDPGGKTSAALERAIEARGYSVKRRADLSADSGTSASQVPVTVNQFQTDGIDTVFVLAGVTTATQFVQQADGQGYRPMYHLGDWANNNNDFTVQNMPRSFQAIGVTHIMGHGNKVLPFEENAAAARCREIHDKHSGRTLQPRGTAEYGATTQNCDSILAFEKVARAAGPELTRARLAAAVATVGTFPIANWAAGRFGSGKSDFVDQLRFQVFDASCSCWKPSGGFFTPK
jgi:ABC-type branched-subunit amino acid transport system substrate-binding protein